MIWFNDGFRELLPAPLDGGNSTNTCQLRGKRSFPSSRTAEYGGLPFPEYLRPAADLFGEAFEDDSVIRWLTSSTPENTQLAYLPTYWYTLLNQALLNNAVLQEAND